MSALRPRLKTVFFGSSQNLKRSDLLHAYDRPDGNSLTFPSTDNTPLVNLIPNDDNNSATPSTNSGRTEQYSALKLSDEMCPSVSINPASNWRRCRSDDRRYIFGMCFLPNNPSLENIERTPSTVNFPTLQPYFPIGPS